MACSDPSNNESGARPRPTRLPAAADAPLWTVIRDSTDALSFDTYRQTVDDLMGTPGQSLRGATELFMASEGATAEGAADLAATDDTAGPQLVELIWSYWLEEGRLAETMSAISLRFQNRRRAGHDPLAELKIDVLRPLNNLLWKYVQDEQHRLTARRRAYEYEHQYGLRVSGAAEPLQPVESRSRFPRAFADLLQRAEEFYAQADDDATADASRLLQGFARCTSSSPKARTTSSETCRRRHDRRCSWSSGSWRARSSPTTCRARPSSPSPGCRGSTRCAGYRGGETRRSSTNGTWPPSVSKCFSPFASATGPRSRTPVRRRTGPASGVARCRGTSPRSGR